MDSPAEKQQPGQAVSPLANVKNPIWKLKLSPRDHNGSTLYDSFELQAVTKQLNRAIHGSNGTLSPYSNYLKSPICCKQLDQIYKENIRTRKRITCSRLGSTKVTRGFVVRLWEKLKRRFVRNKQTVTTSL